jgi:homogentisate 1,2-dioxygenase
VIERQRQGDLPRKHHVAHRDSRGHLRFEHCITRQGFDGPYTIAYHERRPHQAGAGAPTRGFPAPEPAPAAGLARRHYRSAALPTAGGAASLSRLPLLFTPALTVSVARPDRSDPSYFVNGDADDLYFILEGGGVLRSVLGDLPFASHDYVFVPKGILHRFDLAAGPQHWLVVESKSPLGVPVAFRNPAGQLRMDAPYSHRDFRAPVLSPPLDERIRSLIVKRADAFTESTLTHTPFDVVGWDGAVYPFAFAIRDYQPRVGAVHLPPTVHTTFGAPGLLVSSFVPRLLDFAPDAVPCPYPHSSVDLDELIFYASGDFTSRRGIEPGSLSHHPAGIPHGPHPGAYEASIGKTKTEELAVMLDVEGALERTKFAAGIEDDDYHASFVE